MLNYARHRKTGDVIFFDSEALSTDLPLDVLEEPSRWAVYDLPGRLWGLSVHRVGEDGDAREARVIGHDDYNRPLPPCVGVPNRVGEPYRRVPNKHIVS